MGFFFKVFSRNPFLCCLDRQRGMSHLGLFDVSTRTFSKIETPFCDIFGLVSISTILSPLANFQLMEFIRS